VHYIRHLYAYINSLSYSSSRRFTLHTICLESQDAFFIFFSHSNNKLQYVHTLLFFYLFLNFFSGDVKSVLIYVYRYIYMSFSYHLLLMINTMGTSLSPVSVGQVRSQLAGCKQPAIIALGRLPPADQVTETALMAFRSLLEMFALALVSLCICSCPNNPNITLESA